MSKLEFFSVFLTDRLTLAAQEIFKAVEDIFSEYNEEMCRCRQEIELLRRRLQQAGLPLDSETQSCSNETRDNQTFSEDQWRSEQDRKETEVHMKLEVYTQQDESRVQMSVCNESLSPCIDTDQDIETHNSENGFPFINQAVHIKNEPGLHSENDWACEEQYFTRQRSDDPYASDASSDHKMKTIHSPVHRTQACYLPLTNQEMFTQSRMKLAQIRERMSVCQDEEKRKAINARNAQAWRDRLKKDPVKYAEYKALEAARARQYRRKKTDADKEIDKKKNRERQRKFRAKKKLQQFKADEVFKFSSREEKIKHQDYGRIKKREKMDWMGARMKRHICEEDESREMAERNITEAN